MCQWKFDQLVRLGVRHRRSGVECQDYVFSAEDENCIVLALCDGLGSLSASVLASKYTAVAACRLLQQCARHDFRRFASAPDGLLRDILAQLNSLLERRLGEMNVSRKQADSTLAFVCISKRFRFCYAVCLGDSAVCLIRRSGNLCLTESNPNSESTATVDMSRPWEYAKQCIIELDDDDFLGAILTSDGLDGEIFTKDSTQVRKAAEFYFNALNTDSFADTVGERLDTLTQEYGDYFDDDISVAAVSRTRKRVIFPGDPTWLCGCGERNPLEETYCRRCGSDFMDVYRRVNFQKCGGKDNFFRYANLHPEFEQKALGRQSGSHAERQEQRRQTPGYPVQQQTQGYSAQQQGYPAQQQGYPAQQQGYPPQQQMQGCPAQQQGYPAQQQGYPAQQQGYYASPAPFNGQNGSADGRFGDDGDEMP